MSGLAGQFETALRALCGLGRSRFQPGAPGPPTDGRRSGLILGTAMPFQGSGLAEGAPVWLDDDLSAKHVVMYGSSGSGKSALLRRMRRHFYRRFAVLYVDFSGDALDGELRVLASIGADGPELSVIDLRRPDFVTPFNLIGGPGSPHSRAATFLAAVESETGVKLGVRVWYNASAACVALAELGLCATEFRALFSTEPGFRRHVIASVQDAEARAVLEEFDRLVPEAQATYAAELSNKLSRFLSNPNLRLMAGQEGFPDLRAALDRPYSATLVALGAATQPAASLVAKKLLSAVEQNAMARASVPEEARSPARVVIDEASRVAGFGIERLLYEGRRMKVSLVVALQQTTQVEPELREALRANAAVQLFFAAGGLEAAALAGEIACDLSREEVRKLLIGLPVGTAVLVTRGNPPALVKLDYSPVPDADAEAVEALRLAALARTGTSSAEAHRAVDERSAWVASLGGESRIEHVSRPSKGGRRDG